MNDAPVKLREWFAAADTGAPVPGENGFASLVPIGEPASVGLPPHPPVLLEGIELFRPSVRERSRSGHTQKHPAATAPRPGARVVWDGLSRAHFDAVWAFLTLTAGSGAKAFDIEPDGPGTGIVKVIQTGFATRTIERKNGHRIEVEVVQAF